ncbi:set1/Ash2 histone methyltransferase complex subunit ASH2-like [Lineus longissimus]|uniref:set1/Ash2 histone methyltransferase complex subunit ASH2-like n=1 Tax=Lineus longissimus TaxID=88925 RepID=UPI002B4EA422
MEGEEQMEVDGQIIKSGEKENLAEMESKIPSEESSLGSTDTSNGQCYCGKERNFSVAEFLCGSCQKWFHTDCTSSYVGKCLPFMTNYQFFCKNCNLNGQESFSKKQASFKEMVVAAVANLTYQFQERKFFSKDREIIPYIDRYWESLTTMPRRIKLTWHATITKTLTNSSEYFLCNEELPQDPTYGLLVDLENIRPIYDSSKTAFSQAQKPEPKPSNLGLESSIGKATTRGAKRKAAEGFSQLGIKQKRGEMIASTKVTVHGYPVEHPFNKDGYRYYLAEPDPHAPNRQAFDESIEWAGKPIPGYFYRMFQGTDVLLSMNDRAPQLKLSDDRMTVTGDKGYSMVRATHGVNRGAWYFEVNIDEMPADSGAATRIGWSQTLGNLQAPCGYDKFSYSWRSRKGTKFHQSRGKRYTGAYVEGDVIGFYIYLPSPVDSSKLVPATYKDKPLIKFKNNLYYEEKDYIPEAEKGLKTSPGSKIVFYKNGVNQSTAWQDISEGTYYPAFSLYKNSTITVNFGPDFRYPPTDLEDYKPVSDMAAQTVVEHALGDVLYLVENEGNLPVYI